MTIQNIECHVFRAPIATPVRAAVGSFNNRPAVFLRVDASDGAWGWGEVFCNFPPVGAEHRARLAREMVAPMLIGMPSDDPTRTWQDLSGHCRDTADGRVLPYASGIGSDRVAEAALAKQAEGYTAFKFKVGFEPARDLANFREIRDALGPNARIMVDANQAWPPDIAADRLTALEAFRPYWVEEPMAADEALADWRRLARGTPLALAAGENIRGQTDFETAIDNGHLRFIQPDVGKWGGISGCMAVARAAQIAGLTFCPHWLGGDIGLAASMSRPVLKPYRRRRS